MRGDSGKHKVVCYEKAPKHDGFPMTFYLTFWDTVKEVIKSTIQDFHVNHVIERCFNETYVALIPK